MSEPLRRGDFVRVKRGAQSLPAMVALASPNGRSLLLMYDGALGSYVGFIPVLKDDDGAFRDLHGEPVEVELIV